ncbi:uncharacterized protein [Drosophila suzukii]|uniref:Uncharacterized protein n=1 Tax=Drosophila suzukii TaxID=28584 RepID=A0ABM4TX87_DROSZ
MADGRSPSLVITTEENEIEWDEDLVNKRRMWRLRRARDPSVDAIFPGYAEAFEGAAKGRRVKGSTALEMAKANVKKWLDEVVRLCNLIRDMREKIKAQPHKFPDFVFECETLYRQIPQRDGNEYVVTRKLYVLQELTETVLQSYM